jgi:hypothetical protein
MHFSVFRLFKLSVFSQLSRTKPFWHLHPGKHRRLQHRGCSMPMGNCNCMLLWLAIESWIFYLHVIKHLKYHCLFYATSYVHQHKLLFFFCTFNHCVHVKSRQWLLPGHIPIHSWYSSFGSVQFSGPKFEGNANMQMPQEIV